ncbi:cytochrome b-c1 complex subunit Rieske, mitochondrial-like [Maniola hyperantus]|uniref:cytochrome b-c1 complex subunit Rieske, mitochondrial-like n=1 Tax=Aphantopus hyperantus TaxID=2795564 RepID=UPI00156A2DF6|nr:cytochrome b-c1 complex subunit Rieske, mitochondrial-like [Maniola hyperantus]
MNILNGGYISKCSQRVWKNSCCLDYLVNSQYILKKEKGDKVFTQTMIVQRPKSRCLNIISRNFLGLNILLSRNPFDLVLWTQIRFQQGYPKLHRDIEHPSFDYYRKDKYKDLTRTSWHSGDDKKGYTSLIGFVGLLCGMYGAKSELTHFLTSMAAAADVRALASIEVDIANVAPGACVSYKWRGKPLFVKHRTPAEISAEAGTSLSLLRHPETPEQRTTKPEWLIVIGICTHLGCVPVPNSGDWAGGFYCPCHGSHYDNVGRTRKGPAPLNLEVPPYKFLSENLVLVG